MDGTSEDERTYGSFKNVCVYLTNISKYFTESFNFCKV